jgi:tetratricopeptide (TPR) repeat protein
MFTVNIYLKFAIIVVSLIVAVAFTATISFWYALPCYITFVGFLASYLFLGTVQSTAQLLEKMDFTGAEKRLNLTFRPNILYVTNRAFYYIIKGSIAMNLKRTDEAETWFEKAKTLKLPSDNERAMVYLQLANINASRNKWQQAQNYHQQLKKLSVTEPQIREQISQFDKAFKNRGQLRHARSGAAQVAGGKRRRPKMR